MAVTLPGNLSVVEDDREWSLAAVLCIHSSALLLHAELAIATTYTSSILWSNTTTLQMRNSRYKTIASNPNPISQQSSTSHI